MHQFLLPDLLSPVKHGGLKSRVPPEQQLVETAERNKKERKVQLYVELATWYSSSSVLYSCFVFFFFFSLVVYVTVEIPVPIVDANGLSGRLIPWLLSCSVQLVTRSEILLVLLEPFCTKSRK